MKGYFKDLSLYQEGGFIFKINMSVLDIVEFSVFKDEFGPKKIFQCQINENEIDDLIEMLKEAREY